MKTSLIMILFGTGIAIGGIMMKDSTSIILGNIWLVGSLVLKGVEDK